MGNGEKTEDGRQTVPAKNPVPAACRFLIFVFCPFGEGEDKFRTHTFCAYDINVLVVGIDDLLHNRESKTGAFSVFSS